ncbi:PQQ-binding-like beta-propeller repeat protein [Chitinophagales bacterium]|nr:PQQ-binding-like beta-propeller repeat protein [Chitinophagales bacterium]
MIYQYHLVRLFAVLLVSQFTLGQEVAWDTVVDSVYTFSSPRAVDLNGDSVLDFVLGAGVEGDFRESSVLAFNGANGDLLWSASAHDQIFGSPAFLDVNNDGQQDVIIGGRAAELMALDGTTGEIIWEFFTAEEGVNPADLGWYQFYTPAIVPDQDGDGLADLLVANGGDPTILLPNEPRPPGKIMVLSSASGEILANAEVPDGQETYMSPLFIDFWNDGNGDVLFGTGGETKAGSLWRIALADLMTNSLVNAAALVSSGSKGFIAPPSIADLNEDNIADIISHSYDGRVTAINGANNEQIWEYTVPGETNASPGIGFFNDDDVPDVFSSFAFGIAPAFTGFTQLMIDGATGELIRQDSLGVAQFSSPVVLDYDNDNFDEVIFNTNVIQEGDFAFAHELVLFDPNNEEVATLWGPDLGGNVNSTPWIGDADNDGLLDMVYPFAVNDQQLVSDDGLIMRRLDLDYSASSSISWGAYLGNDYNGIFDNPRSNCGEMDYQIEVQTVADACETTASVFAFNCLDDCEFLWSNGDIGEQASNFEINQQHYVQVTYADGCVQLKRFTIESELESFQVELQVTPSDCATSANGEFRADWTGGIPPYTVFWEGQAAGGATNSTLYLLSSLQPGNYQFGIEDAGNCVYSTELNISSPDSLAIELVVNETSEPDSADGSVIIGIEGGVSPYVITLNGGVVQENVLAEGLAAGDYIVAVSDMALCYLQDEFAISASGIEDLEAAGWSVSPNPVQDELAINYPDGIVILSLNLFSEMGDFVMSIDPQSRKVDLSDLPSGLYLLALQTKEQSRFLKVLKR